MVAVQSIGRKPWNFCVCWNRSCSPFLDRVAAVITMLGEETVFMLVGMALLWCFDKKWGFRFFFIGLVGNTLNQLMKAIFLIPRPWVLDESFTIVEAAREAATGYSFPSGHTQTVVTVFGTLAAWQRKSGSRFAALWRFCLRRFHACILVCIRRWTLVFH